MWKGQIQCIKKNSPRKTSIKACMYLRRTYLVPWITHPLRSWRDNVLITWGQQVAALIFRPKIRFPNSWLIYRPGISAITLKNVRTPGLTIKRSCTGMLTTASIRKARRWSYCEVSTKLEWKSCYFAAMESVRKLEKRSERTPCARHEISIEHLQNHLSYTRWSRKKFST